MARFTFTQDDILRGKLITPGWYPLEVYDVEESAAKTDGSENTTVKFRVAAGPFLGVPVERLFNEKAPGFAKPLLESLGAKVEAGAVFDLSRETLAGKRVEGYIKNETTNRGNVRNAVADFRPIRTAA